MGKVVRYYCDFCDTDVLSEEDLVKTTICHEVRNPDWNTSLDFVHGIIRYDTYEVCQKCKGKLDKYYAQATKKLLDEIKSK